MATNPTSVIFPPVDFCSTKRNRRTGARSVCSYMSTSANRATNFHAWNCANCVEIVSRIRRRSLAVLAFYRVPHKSSWTDKRRDS